MSDSTQTTAKSDPENRPDDAPAGADDQDERFDDDFMAGWNDGAVASEPEDPPDPNPENDPPAPVASGEDGQPSGEVPPDADAGGAEDPAGGEGGAPESSQQDQPPTPGPDPAPPQGGQGGDGTDPDPRDAELQRLRKALHDSKSEVGRVRGFLHERDAKLASLEQQAPQDRPPPEDAVSTLSEEERKKVEDFASEMDPDTSEIIDLKIRDALARERQSREQWQQNLELRHQGIESWRSEQEQSRVAERAAEGAAQLDERYGQSWRQEYNDGRLTAWVEGMPPRVSRTFQEILTNSDDPADAVYLMETYYRDNPERTPQREEPPPPPADPAGKTATQPPAPADPPPPPPPPPPADPRLEQRRQSQLRGGRTPPRNAGGGPPSRRDGGGTGDGNAEFNAGWEEGALNRDRRDAA